MLGLPNLANFLLGVFVSLTTFFKAYIAGRFVVAAAFTTVLIGMTAALFIASNHPPAEPGAFDL